jgi:hypothetical protein
MREALTDAVVLPGRLYGPTAPLLMYAGDVAERRGITVHRHTWSAPPYASDDPGIVPWVEAEVTPLLDNLAGRPLLIGKSLGSHATGLAAARSLPAVWLTPLLTLPWVAAALERASAPFLLVGGTADEAWDADLAYRLTPHVCSVRGADHGMYVPGPLTDSIAVLARVVTAIEDFLHAIG